MSQLKAYRLQTLVFLAVLLSAATLTKASVTLDENSVQKLSSIAVDLPPALPQVLEEEEKLEEDLENKENDVPFEAKVQGGETEKLEEDLENKENALPIENKGQGGETEKLEEDLENKENALPIEDKVQESETEKLEEEVENEEHGLPIEDKVKEEGEKEKLKEEVEKEHALTNEEKVKEEEVGGGKREEESKKKENTADRQYYDQWQYQQSYDYQWQYQQSHNSYKGYDYYYGREAELGPSRTYDEAVKARDAGLLSSVLYTIGDVFNPRPTYYSYNRPSSYYYPSSNYYYNRPNSYYSSYAPYRRIRFAARRPASAPRIRAIGSIGSKRPNPVRPRLRQRLNLAGPRRQRLSPARPGRRHQRPARRRYVPHLVMSTTK